MAKKSLGRDMGWKSPYDRQIYYPIPAGMGNPPSCPTFQMENPGQGRCPMVQVPVEVFDDGSFTEVEV